MKKLLMENSYEYKKGEIKDLENKYGVAWSIFSDYGNYEPLETNWENFKDNGDGSFTKIKNFKSPMTKEEVAEHYRKMDEEWVIDNSSQEEDGNYFLHDAGIFSETEMIIKSGKIDIESALKACDEILRKENTMTLHYIERFGKKESVNGKDCIKVGFGT